MEAVLSIAEIIEIETASDKLHISENGTTFLYNSLSIVLFSKTLAICNGEFLSLLCNKVRSLLVSYV